MLFRLLQIHYKRGGIRRVEGYDTVDHAAGYLEVLLLTTQTSKQLLARVVGVSAQGDAFTLKERQGGGGIRTGAEKFWALERPRVL